MEQRNQWWLVVGAGLAVFLATLDMTIVNVALPTIEADLQTRSTGTQWVVLGYLLPIIALSLPSGRWLDLVGRRSALTFSAIGFTVASAVAGAAPTIGWLVGARVLQGVFAAVLFALIPVLATIAVRPEARGRALGVASILGPLGALTGPALGGLLVETLGWPWIFYVNIPVALLVVVIGLAQLPAGAPLRVPDRAWFAEAVLLAGAGTALLLGLTLTAKDGPAWLVLLLAAAPPLLVWRRMRTSATVRNLLRRPGMPAPHVVLLSAATAAAIVMFLAPFYLQRVLDTSAGIAGLTLLSFPLGVAIFGPAAGWLTDYWGGQRTVLAGTVINTAGLLLLVPLGTAWTPIDLTWRLGVLGVGFGLLSAPSVAMAMSRSPGHLLGTTGASTSTARQLGLALGPALATTVWAASGYHTGGMRAAFGLAAAVSVLGIVALARPWLFPGATSPATASDATAGAEVTR